MNRLPAVADRFYPGDPNELRQTISSFLVGGSAGKKKNVLGVVSPHAGYIYSGQVCGEVLREIEIPETVVILGPNHHGRGPSISLSQQDWQMPFGTVPINRQFSKLLLESNSDIVADDIAHQFEHSLEVQVPFLQELQSDLSIVPLALSQLSFAMCEKLAASIAAAVSGYNKPVLLLASSDMSHYESRKSAEKKDAMALQQLKALDPGSLYKTVMDNRISMCGIIPVTVTLKAAILLGANSAEVIRYTDSGEISGDIDQVVGYAGAIISKD